MVFEADYVGFVCPDEFVVGRSSTPDKGVKQRALTSREEELYSKRIDSDGALLWTLPLLMAGFGIDFSEKYRTLPYIGVPTDEAVARGIAETEAAKA